MDPFAVLATGVKFEKRPKQPHGKRAIHAVAQPLPDIVQQRGQQQQQQPNKRRKKHQQAAGAPEVDHDDGGDAGGISLFGGSLQHHHHHQQQQQQQQQEPELPHVHSNDPYEESNLIRKALRIKVKGADIPHPIKHWADLEKQPTHRQDRSRHQQQPQPLHQEQHGRAAAAAAAAAAGGGAQPELAICGHRLLAHLEANGWGTPTPIQRQAVPALLARRELLAVAPTGSGKTLAFLLPMLALLNQAKQRGGDAWPAGPKALLLSPTHELAGQTARVLKLLLPGSGLRCCLLNRASAGTSDFTRVDVLVANPLRLKCLVEEGRVDLSTVSYLVLDEADKLLAMGFTEQVDALLAAASNPHITRALFSATLPDKVEALARSVLRDPLHMTVGERNTAQSLVSQRLVFVGKGDGGRRMALRQLLSGGGSLAADGSSIGGLLPPILVFVASKERAKTLHKELLYEGIHVDSISGDQPNRLRTAAVDNFRAGRTWVLIATDLIGRGMDFAGVNTVVNYDCPTTAADYIHRIGRTGRAGHAGQAITFFSEEDAPRLRSIAHLAAQAGSEVPDWMLHLTKQRDRKREKVLKARKRMRAEAQQQDQQQQQPQRRRRPGLLEADSDDEGGAGGGAGGKQRGSAGRHGKKEGQQGKKQRRQGGSSAAAAAAGSGGGGKGSKGGKRPNWKQQQGVRAKVPKPRQQ